MKLHELTPKNKKVARKRRGQGNATGNGTYGGRGMNGQNARSGGGVRPGFEGGQTPLIKRMPKMRGFRSPNKVYNQVIKLAVLEEIFKDGAKVDFAALVEAGLVTKKGMGVKILNDGTALSKKLNISEVLISKTAKEAVEKAGGKVEVTVIEEPESKKKA
jgi:large subunit ribosomal protein L15